MENRRRHGDHMRRNLRIRPNGDPMTEPTIEVHKILGLTNPEFKDLADDILRKTRNTKTIHQALNNLAEDYDPKSMLVGMRMMQMMDLNKRAFAAKKGQAFFEAFGQRQKAELN